MHTDFRIFESGPGALGQCHWLVYLSGEGPEPAYGSVWMKERNNSKLANECHAEVGDVGSKSYLFQEARKAGLFAIWEIKPI